MSSLPTFVLPHAPMLWPRLAPRRLAVLAGAALLAAGLAAGGWYLLAHRHGPAPSATRLAAIAAARTQVMTAARARGVKLTAAAAKAPPVPTSTRVADASLAGELFATHSWYVPPPPPPPAPPPKVEPPPPPMAPPLPFAFLGSYTPAGDATVFFLTRGDRVYDVKVGDVLDGTYSVESAAGGLLTFNYKPLDQRQTLAIGATP
jgi:hypothetical protein